MSKQQEGDSRLGHDPLEWLQDEENESEQASVKEESPPSQVASPPDEQPKPDSEGAEQDICIVLPEKIKVQATEGLQKDWIVILESKPVQVILNAEHMIDADAAGVQLLFAFVQQLGEQEAEVRITNVSEHIGRIFELSGVSSFFEKYIDAA